MYCAVLSNLWMPLLYICVWTDFSPDLVADLFPAFSPDLVDELFPDDFGEDFLVAFDDTLEEGYFGGLVDLPFAFLVSELFVDVDTARFGVCRVFPSAKFLSLLLLILVIADKLLDRLKDLRFLAANDGPDSSLSVLCPPATRVNFNLVLGLDR